MNPILLGEGIAARILRFKMKSFLMAVGLLISVVATVLVQTAGAGFRDAFNVFIDRAYPSDTLYLLAGNGVMGGDEVRNKLRRDDIETILASIPDIVAWEPRVQSGDPREVKVGTVNISVPVWGSSERLEEVLRRTPGQGTLFSENDINDRERVAIIGDTVARRLFPNGGAVGAQLFIDSVPFTVKGVIAPWGVDPHGADQDDMIQLPYTTWMDMLRIDYLAGVTFKVRDRSQIEATAARITTLMRERHHILQGQEDDFSVLTGSYIKGLVEKFFRVFNIFLPLVSVTAFLISGLVVMGITFVSIKERTPEIGLRKALGARPVDLQRQILLEVLTISLIGALAGLLLTEVLAMFFGPVAQAHFGVRQFSPSVSTLLLAMAGALAAALLGAVLPARRASRLSPLEALR